jgi:hypothetical protein
MSKNRLQVQKHEAVLIATISCFFEAELIQSENKF